MKKLLLANIKADLDTIMGSYDRRAELESSDPHALAEAESYEDDLQQEL